MAEPASKTRAAIGVLTLLCGALMIALIVRSSLDPDNYFRYVFERRSAEPWEHPTGAVAFVALATLLESASMCFVFALTRPGRVSMRGAASLVVLVPWSAVSSAVIVRAPGFTFSTLFGYGVSWLASSSNVGDGNIGSATLNADL